MIPPSVIPLLLLSPLLIAVGYFDLRYMRIPNVFSLVALAVFAMMALMFPAGDLGSRLLAAAAILVIGFGSFAMGLFGGGDVKVLAVMMLFVPTSTLAIFAFVFAGAMASGILAVLILRTSERITHSGWKGLASIGSFPMGVSLAVTGILHPIVVAIVT